MVKVSDVEWEWSGKWVKVWGAVENEGNGPFAQKDCSY